MADTFLIRYRTAACLLLLAGALMAGCSADETPSAPAASTPTATAAPNILLIIVDDMGYSDIGAFGGEILTPNIDSLAYSGVRFSNFHAAPACTPTRAMLMTGMSSYEGGVGDMWVKRIFDHGRAVPREFEHVAGNSAYAGYLNQAVTSLPEALQERGYRTYMTGKWDLGRALIEEHIPANQGFDRSFVSLLGAATHLGEPGGGARGGIVRADYYVYREDHDVVKSLPEDFFSTHAYTDKLIGYLEEHQQTNQPFFAFFSPTAPHWPLQLPNPEDNPYRGQYDDGYDALAAARLAGALKAGVIPPAQADNPTTLPGPAWSELSADDQAYSARLMELYAGMMSDLDSNIGRIVEFLESSGMAENTLILFMSDNGASGGTPPFNTYYEGGWNNELSNLGNYNSFVGLTRPWAVATMAGLRDTKASPFDGGTRVAAFATGTGVTATPGGVSPAWMGVMDIMPTLLEIADRADPGAGAASAAFRGRSFLPVLEGQDAEVHPGDENRAFEFGGNRWVVRGDWKAVKRASSEDWVLFDLSQDPAETTDVAATQPEMLEGMVADWHTWADDVGLVLDIPTQAAPSNPTN